jgi:hypothetical protein
VASIECAFFVDVLRRPFEPPARKLVVGEGLPALCLTGVLRAARMLKSSPRVLRPADVE